MFSVNINLFSNVYYIRLLKQWKPPNVISLDQTLLSQQFTLLLKYYHRILSFAKLWLSQLKQNFKNSKKDHEKR
jgi:hypothetical protein